MNRATLGLAVGAGYFLGRTKKLKLAFAVGTMVAGKKLQLSPKAVMDLARTQLEKNPQFKEIGGQLRQDFRGVGKAATGAILERQMEGLAGRLHSSTAGVRDRIAGVAPDTGDVEDVADKATGGLSGKVTGRSSKDRDRDDHDDRDAHDDPDEIKNEDKSENKGEKESRRGGDRAQDADRPAPRKRAPAKKSAASGERKSAPRKRTQSASQGTARKSTSSAAKKTTGAARRAPRGGAKGERGNG